MDVQLVLRSLEIVMSEIKTYLNNQQTIHEAERHSSNFQSFVVPYSSLSRLQHPQSEN